MLFGPFAAAPVAVASAPQSLEEEQRRLDAFHKLYDPYFRQTMGCPKPNEDGSAVECRPQLGGWSYGMKAKLRAEAKRLFDLRD